MALSASAEFTTADTDSTWMGWVANNKDVANDIDWFFVIWLVIININIVAILMLERFFNMVANVEYMLRRGFRGHLPIHR